MIKLEFYLRIHIIQRDIEYYKIGFEIEIDLLFIYMYVLKCYAYNIYACGVN